VFRPGGESAGQSWVSWGTQNKYTNLRKIAGSHWEIKCLDAVANTYLALAAIIAAGTEGVRKRDVLIWGDCVSKDPSKMSKEERDKLNITEKLPRTLPEALAALEADQEMHDMLGGLAVKIYLATKEAELRILKPMNDEQRRNWLIERY
jgi:glutamine synthetase